VTPSSIREMLKTRLNREAIYSTAAYWDKKASELQGDAVSMWPNNHLNRYYHREQMSLIERLLPSVEGIGLLDVGCGTGRTSRYLASRGARVLGIDFSAKAIEIAMRQSSGDNPEFKVQSVFDLDDTARFDLALSWGTFVIAARNRSELLNILQRVGRALKPGGHLLLCEPIHKGFLHRVLNMDLRNFSAVMTEAGFKIEETHHLHFWPMRLCLAYVRWWKFITATGYWLGQGTMGLFGNKALGDYKAIYARRVA
jgi:2-polyprenyl-3-methyl-5-hydroxy-6-metoxy-1,4-benzoquinol methylase